MVCEQNLPANCRKAERHYTTSLREIWVLPRGAPLFRMRGI
jgi:hypothetical protein